MSSVADLYPTFGDHVPGPSCPCHPEVVNTADETVYNHQSISNLGAKLRAALARAEALQTKLDAANEDAERLAANYTSYGHGDDYDHCIHCQSYDVDDNDEIVHTTDCPITLHRARVGGGK